MLARHGSVASFVGLDESDLTKSREERESRDEERCQGQRPLGPPEEGLFSHRRVTARFAGRGREAKARPI
jgi:hypothetical protein